jgi:ribosome biogenesis GTPase A
LQQSISWYPGHMAKARRLLLEQLGRVDLVIELCDARLPLSSRNPDLESLKRGKPTLLLLNKSDLADPDATRRWLSFFAGEGVRAMAVEMGRRKQSILQAVEALSAGGLERAAARGLPRAARAMVLGVPNVGKSTLINYLAGRAALKVQDRPGVTRAPQWLSASPALELLDSPGLLWPRLGDPAAARRLAYIAAVRDEVLDTYRLSLDLLEELMKLPGNRVRERFRLGGEELRGQALLEAICVSRGFLLRGGEPDLERGAACVLDEFRSGLLGRVTLETPGEAPDAGS